MNHQYLFFIAGGVLVFWLCIITYALVQIRRQWRELLGPRTKKDHAIAAFIGEHRDIQAVLASHEQRLDILERVSAVSVQYVGFLRFNPFSETGGDNSFALALLDGSYTGVVISSLYTREGVRVYAKAVERAHPKQPLSQEEEKAVAQAMKRASPPTAEARHS